MKRLMLVMVLALSLLFIVACDEDSPTDPEAETPVDPWVGTWLSAGSDVAPLLVSLFQYDSIRVEIVENQVVKTHSHIKDGAWSTVEGTWQVTKSASGDVHNVQFIYAAFSQDGILQITTGTPDVMQMEVVQTVPDIGATPRTPETGFGSDVTLGTYNIQKYVRE